MRQLAVPTPYLVGDIKVYSCVIKGQLILFDTGPVTDKALRFLEQNVDLDRLQYVFITHWHPEHCGLAALLEKRTGAKIIVSRHEVNRLKQLEEQLNNLRILLGQLGFPADDLELLAGNLRVLYEGIPTPDNLVSLEESEGLLESLGIEYFYCPFHSARDVIYLVGDYAVSGDIVLNKTYSSPSIEPDPMGSTVKIFNNYRAFCTAISQLKKIEQYTLLPSHGEPVKSIDVWLGFMVAKIIERTSAVAPLLQQGSSVYQATVNHFGDRVKRNQLFYYIKASEVNLSKDFLQNPQLLLEALKENGLMARFDSLLKHEWLQRSASTTSIKGTNS
jgi:hydroxyacylglutathione hydrolase